MRRVQLAVLALVIALAALAGGEILWGDAIVWGTLDGDDQIIWGTLGAERRRVHRLGELAAS